MSRILPEIQGPFNGIALVGHHRMPDGDTLTIHDTEIQVEHIDTLPSGGARFDFTAEGKRWRVDITRSGGTEIVTTWADGQLADLDEPDWLDEVVARLAKA